MAQVATTRHASNCSCGFKKGDRVKMKTKIVLIHGGYLTVHGAVREDPISKCHVIIWDETKEGTELPNENVKKDDEEPS